jgi:hypothetical protein
MLHRLYHIILCGQSQFSHYFTITPMFLYCILHFFISFICLWTELTSLLLYWTELLCRPRICIILPLNWAALSCREVFVATVSCVSNFENFPSSPTVTSYLGVLLKIGKFRYFSQTTGALQFRPQGLRHHFNSDDSLCTLGFLELTSQHINKTR